MMSFQIDILALTANTPVDIYCCDISGNSCVYIATISTPPFIFDAPSGLTSSNFIVKIVDTQNLIDQEIIYITPAATSTPTPTITPSISLTPSVTFSPTPTVSSSPTQTLTPSITPTQTPSVTTSPVSASHSIGSRWFTTSGGTMTDYLLSGVSWYTYISVSNTIPVVGATIYSVQYGSTLYNVVSSENLWRLMTFGGEKYAVRINSDGNISDFNSIYL